MQSYMGKVLRSQGWGSGEGGGFGGSCAFQKGVGCEYCLGEDGDVKGCGYGVRGVIDDEYGREMAFSCYLVFCYVIFKMFFIFFSL